MTEMQAATAKRPTAEELVKRRHPHAFAEDDGEWIHIRVRVSVIEPCPTCGQQRTHQKLIVGRSLGSAGNESDAWKRAAVSLGLL